MSTKSEQERERLKEEYKEHYRKVRDAKEKLRRSKYVQNVNEAIHKMNTDELLTSVDDFLGTVRNKMANFEARLDVAMDQFLEDHPDTEEQDEELRKARAHDTLKQIKQEMGMLYSEIEHQARNMNVEKTVGRKETPDASPGADDAESGQDDED
jgi:phage shock protein A